MQARLRRIWDTFQHRRVMRRLAGPKIIRAFADAYPEAFFVEIGANDGDRHDHLAQAIRGQRWRGIMVEPVPYVFERLRSNYRDVDRVIPENSAITNRVGTMPFYHLAEASEEERGALPDWYDTLGSFSRDVVMSHARAIPDIAERLRRTDVPCLTFAALCAKHGVERVDLIVIDTEGYDLEIIRGIDLAAVRPRMLVYEHYHLGTADQAACRMRIEGLGYAVLEEGFDSFCLDTSVDDRLSRLWRRLRPGVPAVFAENEPTGA